MLYSDSDLIRSIPLDGELRIYGAGKGGMAAGAGAINATVVDDDNGTLETFSDHVRGVESSSLDSEPRRLRLSVSSTTRTGVWLCS